MPINLLDVEKMHSASPSLETLFSLETCVHPCGQQYMSTRVYSEAMRNDTGFTVSFDCLFDHEWCYQENGKLMLKA